MPKGIPDKNVMYSVSWNIEVIASSPEEAAEQALESILTGVAHVFEVTDPLTDKISLVDLDKREEHDE